MEEDSVGLSISLHLCGKKRKCVTNSHLLIIQYPEGCANLISNSLGPLDGNKALRRSKSVSAAK